MEWLLRPETGYEKVIVMLVAILAFAALTAVVLVVVDLATKWRVVTVVGYLGPALVLIAFGLLVPGILTIIQSFRGETGADFVGLENYKRVFTDPAFLLVLRNTLLWVLLVPVLATALGLIYAVLVDRTRVEKFAKTLIFLPMAISMVGASVIWKFMLEYRSAGREQIGLANQLLVWLGLPPQQFIASPPMNTFVLIMVMIWIQAGFAMTVLSAAIKAIPDDIIEAARMDGVGGIRLFWWITIPSVRPAIIVVLTTIAMGTLKAFDVVKTMTGGQFDSSVVANEFYIQSFTNQQQGIGSALAVLLFVIILPIIGYNVWQMKVSEGER